VQALAYRCVVSIEEIRLAEAIPVILKEDRLAG
jgi:hypothetical protein